MLYLRDGADVDVVLISIAHRTEISLVRNCTRIKPVVHQIMVSTNTEDQTLNAFSNYCQAVGFLISLSDLPGGNWESSCLRYCSPHGSMIQLTPTHERWPPP